MKEVAELIRPDQVIFTAMSLNPSQFIIDEINKLKNDLAYLEIDVQWYPLHYWTFDPSPIH